MSMDTAAEELLQKQSLVKGGGTTENGFISRIRNGCFCRRSRKGDNIFFSEIKHIYIYIFFMLSELFPKNFIPPLNPV